MRPLEALFCCNIEPIEPPPRAKLLIELSHLVLEHSFTTMNPRGLHVGEG